MTNIDHNAAMHLISFYAGRKPALAALDARSAKARTEAARTCLAILRAYVSVFGR